ncbi:MAG: phosphotransferase [Nocardioidaceae bacterium]
MSAVIGHLGRLSRVPPALVHGDLVPQNILTANGRPTAVLDFGFLSTIGDPAFDAAITASISDMYGPAAARSEALLDEAVIDRFGYDPARLAIYRAAYALITANCFSASGNDGHFEWCVRVLERPSVRAALSI